VTSRRLNNVLSLQLLHADDVVPGAVQQVRDIRTPAARRGRVSVPSVVSVHRTRRSAEHGRLVRVGGRRIRIHPHPVDRHSVHTHVAVDAPLRAPAWRQVLLR